MSVRKWRSLLHELKCALGLFHDKSFCALLSGSYCHLSVQTMAIPMAAAIAAFGIAALVTFIVFCRPAQAHS